MSRVIVIVTFMLLFQGCSRPTFVWKAEAKNSLLMYQKMMFEGDPFQADFYYRDALEEAKKSTDLKLLAKIYLTSCAIHQSLFIQGGCTNYDKIKPLVNDAELDSYETFILGGALSGGRPGKYASVIEGLNGLDAEAVASGIASLSTVYSKAVAASVAAKKGLLSETLIDDMINEASKYSMKHLMMIWMEQKVTHLTKTGRESEALLLKEKLKFLTH